MSADALALIKLASLCLLDSSVSAAIPAKSGWLEVNCVKFLALISRGLMISSGDRIKLESLNSFVDDFADGRASYAS
jgi:hypothetical protein